MRIYTRPLLVGVIAAGATFIIGYLMGFSHAPARGAQRSGPAVTAPAMAAVAHAQALEAPTAALSDAPADTGAERAPDALRPFGSAQDKPVGVPQAADPPKLDPAAGTGVNPGPRMGTEPRGADAKSAPPSNPPAPAAAAQPGAAVPPPAGAVPRIEFPQAEYHFGSVLTGDDVEHEFVFRNTGAATLVIERVRTSCGCTAALVSAKEIPPGGEGSIKATFRSAGFKGQITKSIYVDTNDPTQPRATLKMNGEVKVQVDASPTSIYARSMSLGEATSHMVTITGVEGFQFEVSRVWASRAEIEVGELHRLGPGRYQVEVTLRPTAEGPLTGSVNIETDSQRQPRVSVRVFANVAQAAS